MQKLTPHTKLFSDSWTLYKKNWLNWGLILVLPLALNLILAFTGGYMGIGNLILLIVLVIVFGVVQVWAELSLLMAVAGTSKKFNLMDAYKNSWPRLGAFFGLTALMFLVLLGATSLLIIPGIMMAVYLCFSAWILADENGRSFDALLRSKHLVSGYW